MSVRHQYDPSASFAFDFDGTLPISAQKGMAAADDHADVRWKRETDAAIRQVALTHETFTADEVVEEMNRNEFHWTTHNQSALGPRMVEVSKTLKYMTAMKDEWKRSTREKSHGNLLKVWRSNIWRKP